MTRVILDVPKDKMQPFLQAILDIGIARHAISSNVDVQLETDRTKISLSDSLRQISKSFILFDWEFFSNELEYE